MERREGAGGGTRSEKQEEGEYTFDNLNRITCVCGFPDQDVSAVLPCLVLRAAYRHSCGRSRADENAGEMPAHLRPPVSSRFSFLMSSMIGSSSG